LKQVYRIFLAALVGLATCGPAPAYAEEQRSQFSIPQIREFDSPCRSYVGYFKKNKTKLNSDMVHLIQHKLTERALKECPELFIAITGQSNSSETARYGDDLSKRRAVAVESLFIKVGFPEERLIIRWVGDRKAEDQTAIGQELSQKVEIDFWRSKDSP
jgi:outer membrane protein OmpA-like peptidoglycan-associated protein